MFMLQKDPRSVIKGWLFSGKNWDLLFGKFDVLLQEAQRCDGTLNNSFKHSSNSSVDHLVRKFTKLMLQGNVHAAVRWVTERTGGGLLNPTTFVVDALKSKHPEPQIPLYSALPQCESFPFMEDVEVTVAQVQFIAGRLQGGAGPGGCQSAHGRDALLIGMDLLVPDWVHRPCTKTESPTLVDEWYVRTYSNGNFLYENGNTSRVTGSTMACYRFKTTHTATEMSVIDEGEKETEQEGQQKRHKKEKQEEQSEQKLRVNS